MATSQCYDPYAYNLPQQAAALKVFAILASFAIIETLTNF